VHYAVSHPRPGDAVAQGLVEREGATDDPSGTVWPPLLCAGPSASLCPPEPGASRKTTSGERSQSRSAMGEVVVVGGAR
jgi:hypothetical protein